MPFIILRFRSPSWIINNQYLYILHLQDRLRNRINLFYSLKLRLILLLGSRSIIHFSVIQKLQLFSWWSSNRSLVDFEEYSNCVTLTLRVTETCCLVDQYIEYNNFGHYIFEFSYLLLLWKISVFFISVHYSVDFPYYLELFIFLFIFIFVLAFFFLFSFVCFAFCLLWIITFLWNSTPLFNPKKF